MGNLFWNSKEKRLRFLWRFFFQSLLWLVPYSLFSALTILITNTFATNSSGTEVISASSVMNILSGVWMLVCMVFSVWFAGKFVDHRSFKDYGFHFNLNWGRDFGFGLVLGGLLMFLIFMVEITVGWIHIDDTWHGGNANYILGLLGSLIFFICVGIYEEVWIRGYLLRNLAEALHSKFLGSTKALVAAYLVSSLFFGFLHSANPNATLVSSISIAAAGLFLGLGFILTKNLAIPIGIHISWNFFEGNVFGYPVSGINRSESILLTSQSGSPLWTGGAFGPEAGLIGVAALLLGSILILTWVYGIDKEVTLQNTLAEFHSVTGGGLDPLENASPNNRP